jgi:hypothetical protein
VNVIARKPLAPVLCAIAAIVTCMVAPSCAVYGTPFVIETIDQPAGGEGTSLALDAFGSAHVTYQDAASGALEYAVKSGGAWTIETVDAASNAGTYSSLELDIDGNPHVTYQDKPPDGAVKYARKSAGIWLIDTVQQSIGYIGYSTSLELDALGNVHMTYSNPGAVRYVRKSGDAWTLATVESQYEPWDVEPSLALDRQGNPRVTYLRTPTEEDAPFALRYARWTGSTWSREIADDGGDDYPGTASSLLLDAQDNPHVSYHEGGGGTGDELRYAWKSAGVWTIETVDGNGSANYGTSMAFDAQGNPHVSYSSGPASVDDLKYARKLGGVWITEVVDGSANFAGLYSSLALDAAGNPHITYHDTTTDELKYAYVIPTSAVPATGEIELMTVSPNPSRGEGARVFVRAPAQLSEIDLALYDITGRRVASLASSRADGGAWRATWNGADDAGRRVAPGAYWVRARSQNGRIASERLTVVR